MAVISFDPNFDQNEFSLLPLFYQSSGNLQFLHGTGLLDAQNMMANGISYTAAYNCGGTGSLWTITNHDPSLIPISREWASFYAKSGSSEGPYVVLSFSLPLITVGNLLKEGSVWLSEGPGGMTYEWNSRSFETINETIGNAVIEFIEE